MQRPTVHPRRSLVLGLVVLGVVLALLGPASASAEPAGPDPVGVWPLQPRPEVVDGFDPPSSTWGAGHRGVDLLGRPGQRVRTALPGTVTFAGVIAGRGVVVVDHGATRTTYEPVAPSVDRGARVAAGAPLGTLQLAGSHCLPRACLHWGWLEGTVYLDPLRLVGLGPVRLLPPERGAPVGDSGPVPVEPASPYAGWVPLVRLFRGIG